MSSFEALGFLSTGVEQERLVLRKTYQAEFEKVEEISAIALSDLRSAVGEAVRPYLVGLGYWIRCIECCQASVLLVERGLPTAPFPPMRTAFECLFFACALWRNPALETKIKVAHDYERIRQATTMLKAGAASGLDPSQSAVLRTIAAETLPTDKGLSAWDAAAAAGLTLEYETAYRGFGIGGAHASLRSLDDVFSVQLDGSVSIAFEPKSRQTSFLLGLATNCLIWGIDRHREAVRQP